jgi:hypothetical protein
LNQAAASDNGIDQARKESGAQHKDKNRGTAA